MYPDLRQIYFFVFYGSTPRSSKACQALSTKNLLKKAASLNEWSTLIWYYLREQHVSPYLSQTGGIGLPLFAEIQSNLSTRIEHQMKVKVAINDLRPAGFLSGFA